MFRGFILNVSCSYCCTYNVLFNINMYSNLFSNIKIKLYFSVLLYGVKTRTLTSIGFLSFCFVQSDARRIDGTRKSSVDVLILTSDESHLPLPAPTPLSTVHAHSGEHRVI